MLDRMTRLDSELHAFCTPTLELALANAKRIESEIMAGRDAGVLGGVPVSIKDLIFTKGVRTTSGSVVFRDFIPDEDDIAVERLKAAGAMLLGKTNTAEFSYSATGHNPLFATTRNPWNLAMTPGGSSAGAGAALAAGLGPIALGSDGGGSVRIPASHCGVYGLKPSMGRIPLYEGSRDERYPGASGWESIECCGPLTRTVRDAACREAESLKSSRSIPPANDALETTHSVGCRANHAALENPVNFVASCQSDPIVGIDTAGSKQRNDHFQRGAITWLKNWISQLD